MRIFHFTHRIKYSFGWTLVLSQQVNVLSIAGLYAALIDSFKYKHGRGIDHSIEILVEKALLLINGRLSAMGGSWRSIDRVLSPGMLCCCCCSALIESRRECSSPLDNAEWVRFTTSLLSHARIVFQLKCQCLNINVFIYVWYSDTDLCLWSETSSFNSSSCMLGSLNLSTNYMRRRLFKICAR